MGDHYCTFFTTVTDRLDWAINILLRILADTLRGRVAWMDINLNTAERTLP